MAFDPVLGWADPVRLRDGRSVLIRPARRFDAELVRAFVRGLSAASRYERFFLAFRELPPNLLERIVGADQQHDVSLLALTAYDDVSVAVVGLAQYGIDGGSDAAEVAVVIGEHWRRAGLATRMLLGLAEFGAANGLERVQAEILQENAAALRLATKFDAGIGRGLLGANVVRVSRPLAAARPSC
jgi:acetyltransferase